MKILLAVLVSLVTFSPAFGQTSREKVRAQEASKQQEKSQKARELSGEMHRNVEFGIEDFVLSQMPEDSKATTNHPIGRLISKDNPLVMYISGYITAYPMYCRTEATTTPEPDLCDYGGREVQSYQRWFELKLRYKGDGYWDLLERDIRESRKGGSPIAAEVEAQQQRDNDGEELMEKAWGNLLKRLGKPKK